MINQNFNPNDPSLRSFVDYGPDCPFPIQNLPFGIFSTTRDPHARVGVAIGGWVLDLALMEREGLLVADGGSGVFSRDSLNDFMALGPATWKSVRGSISTLLQEGTATLRDNAVLRSKALIPQADAHLHLPVRVAGFTDFMVSLNHTRNASRMFGAEPPRNFFHLPIGYNSRASTVVLSETPVVRPLGQLLLPGSESPVFEPSRKLDYEMEIGIFLGLGSQIGEPITMAEAEASIFGFVLLNDWSARDIQAWESVPLGPFLAKSFATSISPWVVLKEALEPFRVEGTRQDPAPLPHLRQGGLRHYDIQMQASIRPAGLAQPCVVSRSSFATMYWSSAQMVTHHASCGCGMQTGDLLGSGTISGPTLGSEGCLLEATLNGNRPLVLETGDSRSFVEDGDEITIQGWCQGEGYRIGFGELRCQVYPSPDPPQGA